MTPLKAVPGDREGPFQHLRGSFIASEKAKDENLINFIERLTLITDKERGFQLSSGRRSTFIFNIKNLFGDPHASYLVTERLFDQVSRLTFDYVAGLELGAVYPVTTLVLRSYGTNRPIKGFTIRKAPKTHGTQNRIEGQRSAPSAGTVLLIDDVTTTGTSLIEGVELVRNLGCEVKQAVTIVDRDEGAKELLSQHDVELIQLFSKHDFTVRE